MNKVVIIVLVLIVVVFVIFVGVGSLTSDEKADPEKMPMPALGETVNKIFGGLQETVDLCKESSAKSEIKCVVPLGKIEINAAKKPFLPFLKKTTFRTVKLIWISGTVSVFYVDKKGGSKIDNPQHFELSNAKKKESLVILEEGGTLTISCGGNGACQVGQQ
jgi:hypothetical protein